jgi:hypothetical protein
MLVCIETSVFCCVLIVEMRTVQGIAIAELGKPCFCLPGSTVGRGEVQVQRCWAKSLTLPPTQSRVWPHPRCSSQPAKPTQTAQTRSPQLLHAPKEGNLDRSYSALALTHTTDTPELVQSSLTAINLRPRPVVPYRPRRPSLGRGHV